MSTAALKRLILPDLKSIFCRSSTTYFQGQEPEPKVREYFYYIDHEGMVFLDDAKIKNFTSCYKEQVFLKQFFKRLKRNDMARYKETFPYIYLCGKERNYIRCDDVPIVYTHIGESANEESNMDLIYYGHGGKHLFSNFYPEKIYMFPQTGRVYHPAEDRCGGVGLVRSKLAIQLSKFFVFENGEQSPPTHFIWKGIRHDLDQNWLNDTINKNGIQIRAGAN